MRTTDSYQQIADMIFRLSDDERQKLFDRVSHLSPKQGNNISEPTDISEFIGILPKDRATELKKHIKAARNEWDREF